MQAPGIKETTTTASGTSTVAGLTAVTGWVRFSQAFSTDTQRFPYTILDSTGAPLEGGIGYLSATGTITREKVQWTYQSSTFDQTSPSAITLVNGTSYTVICGGGADRHMECPCNVISAIDASVQRRFGPANGLANAGTFALVANTLYLVPVKIEFDAELDELGVRVTTGAASSDIRMGIYGCQADGWAGPLLAEFSAGQSVATSNSDVAGSVGPIKLTPGWYWVGLVSNGAPTIRGCVYTVFAQSPAAIRGTIDGQVRHYTATHTYGALPNPAPTSSLTAATGTSTGIYVAMGIV